MPIATFFLIAAVISPAQANWDPKKHLGRTSAQVISMGWEKWEALRLEKRAELTNGEIIDEYTTALGIENTKFAKTKSKARQAWIKKASDLAHILATGWTDMGYSLYDGTRWRTESYWVQYQAELAVRRWLSQKPPAPRAAEPKWQAFASIDQAIRDYEPMEGHTNYKSDIIKARKALGRTHQELVKHMATGTKIDGTVYDILFESVIGINN